MHRGTKGQAAAALHAATALYASAETPPGEWACIATPVHFNAGMGSVTMPEGGLLELRPDEAAALASDMP